MSKPYVELTESEWSVIKAVWETEPCTAPAIQEKLAKPTGWTYSTVRTLMDRMVAKGVLTAKKAGKLTIYHSVVTREQAQRGEIVLRAQTRLQRRADADGAMPPGQPGNQRRRTRQDRVPHSSPQKVHQKMISWRAQIINRPRVCGSRQIGRSASLWKPVHSSRPTSLWNRRTGLTVSGRRGATRWTLASYEVAGNSSKISIRPEGTLDSRPSARPRHSRQRLGVRRPSRLRGAPKRRSGATAAGAFLTPTKPRPVRRQPPRTSHSSFVIR